MKIEIGGNEYNVKVAKTEEEQIEGLQNVKELPKDEGMLFIYEEVEPETSFWMKDTLIPLDIIFINEEGEVISIAQGEPNSEELHTEHDVKYVLEVNKDSGIEEGDMLELEEDENTKVNKTKMLVIGSDGKPQMELEGNERIFSRKNTKTLITIAKRAYRTKLDRDYKFLGTKLFKFLDKQDTTEPEYV